LNRTGHLADVKGPSIDTHHAPLADGIKGVFHNDQLHSDTAKPIHLENDKLKFVADQHLQDNSKTKGDDGKEHNEQKSGNVPAITPIIAVHGVGNAGIVLEKSKGEERKAVLLDQKKEAVSSQSNVDTDHRTVKIFDEVKPSAHPHIMPLKLDEVQPPDHIDGVRMEQDGHLNRNYKKEILIGDHEEFEQAGGEKRLISRLKIIFIKADLNHDAFLSHAELKSWIMFKVQEHLDEAAKENARIFRHLDTDHDGFVTWKEFHIHFLLAKGHDQNDTMKHVEDYDSLKIDSEERERLIRYKFRWAEADEDPQDNQLTVEEMRNFRHPEQSSKMIIRMAKDIIDNLDRDEDELITEEEFIALPAGDIDDVMHERSADETWQSERRKEFHNVIDINHDGKVDVEELKIYVDPHNENHAHLEADNLIQLADENSDGKLSMSEVLDNAELFLGSKMVDTGRNFHDEF
jgi:Ca2+-binding EF-hand superfamily protein